MGQDYRKYTYRVRWSKEDGEYLATVAEFPSLSWFDGNQLEAMRGIANLVKDVIEDMEQDGEPVPIPFSDRRYSGSVRLPIPPEQHRELAIRAAEEGVSLNRLICSLLSRPQTIVATNTNSPEKTTTQQTELYSASLTDSTTVTYESLHLAYSRDDTVSSASDTETFEPKRIYDEWAEEM